jgi:HlyD family secretion protein
MTDPASFRTPALRPRAIRAAVLALLPALFLGACGRTGPDSLALTGIVDATTVRVSAQTPGLITDLTFDEGTQVAVNQRLAVVETERLGYQIDQSRFALEELDHQLSSAQAQARTAAIQRDNARKKYDRFAALLKENAVTQQNVDDLKTQLDAAEEQVRSATMMLQTLTAKKRQVEAGRNVIGRQVKDATILAPIEGTVLVRYAEKGELVGTGSPVCDIADLREVWTKVYLAEKDLATVKLGSAVTVAVDGMPGKTFPGTLTWISDRSEFTPKTILTEETRTTLVYAAKVRMPNPDGMFKIGMPITVSIPRGRR